MRRGFERARAGTWLPPLVVVLVVLGIWEAVAASSRFLIPTISEVWGSFTANMLTILANGGDTLAEALPGVAISSAVAVLVAVAMSEWRPLNRALFPLAVGLNVTPLLALAPALVVLLGYGKAPKIVLAGLITFFPMLINTITGLASTDPDALEVFRTLHASRWEKLWRLRLPSSLPYLFAAARIVVPLSVIGAAVAEMTAPGTGSGLGYLVQLNAAQSQLGLAWAGIVTLAGFGLSLTAIVVVAERTVLRWRGFR